MCFNITVITIERKGILNSFKQNNALYVFCHDAKYIKYYKLYAVRPFSLAEELVFKALITDSVNSVLFCFILKFVSLFSNQGRMRGPTATGEKI